MERNLTFKNLNNEQTADDFIFASFISDLDFIKDDMIMLKTLLGYRNLKMIKLNKLRAVSAIDLAIVALQELRKSIGEVE